MFSEAEKSKPVTRAELEEQLGNYATKDSFRAHINEVDLLVSSLSRIIDQWPAKARPQSDIGVTEGGQMVSADDLDRRLRTQISFSREFDNGLIQIRLSTIQTICDTLRSGVKSLEARVVESLRASQQRTRK